MSFRTVILRHADGVTSIEGDGHVAFGLSVPDGEGGEAGIAAHWLWDGERFELRSDRHGYLPLYHHFDERDGTLVVSDSPLELLAAGVPGDFDQEALGFFCRAGFLLGDRTLHRAIRRVPAGSTLVWEDGRLTIERSESRFELDPPPSLEAAIDGWIDRFREAVRRRPPGDADFAIPLSGGRDSRMILMELRALGHHPVETVSFGPGEHGENEDLRIARLIADRLGLPHVVARSTRSWLATEYERHAWCGCEAIEHAWLIGLWRHFRTNHRCWYDGLGAGAMTRGELNDPRMLALLREGSIAEWCESLYATTAAPPEPWIRLIDESCELAIPGPDSTCEHVRAELERHLDAPNPLARFSFCNWGRRAIALNPYGICRTTAEVHTPFMDRDLVDWTASVPAEWTFENDLQTEACRRLHPELSDIPFDTHSAARTGGAGIRRRIGNWMERARFFSGRGRAFRGLAGRAMRAAGRDPGANPALRLMVHLVLADATRTPGFARDLLHHADPARSDGK